MKSWRVWLLLFLLIRKMVAPYTLLFAAIADLWHPWIFLAVLTWMTTTKISGTNDPFYLDYGYWHQLRRHWTLLTWMVRHWTRLAPSSAFYLDNGYWHIGGTNLLGNSSSLSVLGTQKNLVIYFI